MGDAVPPQELAGKDGIFGSDAQAAPLMGLIIPGQMPEIGAGADIDPGFRYGDDQPTVAIAEVTRQDHQFVVFTIPILADLAIAPMFGQDIVAGDAKRGVAILHERWNIGGALEDHFDFWHAADAREILARIVAIDLHATFGEERERRRL